MRPTREDTRQRLLAAAAGVFADTMRTLVGEIAAATFRQRGLEPPVSPEQLGTVLVALEDGLRLHRLIDPTSTPADAFFNALDTLQQLTALSAST